ncbi:hypothetical protein Plhal703r1_c58g0163711 [Plasmopara halstedii]
MGICLTDDCTITSVFFADTLIFSSSRDAVQAQLDIVNEYCRWSGAKLKMTKFEPQSLDGRTSCEFPLITGARRYGDTPRMFL